MRSEEEIKKFLIYLDKMIESREWCNDKNKINGIPNDMINLARNDLNYFGGKKNALEWVLGKDFGSI